eukprot:CAMPEP_0183833250 /NCGR_PEP_ID=MMETSP0807_2-20130328/5951_1 /TAXON_ID=88271 /ORGANISM="Picocystis salinarum, Strain CCMP1897" /LENGTH=92 /DNA_ID=CAMNT_0026079151 /DNA_START=276 /DNA_END=554 /DNA_ORIENTATION=+
MKEFSLSSCPNTDNPKRFTAQDPPPALVISGFLLRMALHRLSGARSAMLSGLDTTCSTWLVVTFSFSVAILPAQDAATFGTMRRRSEAANAK